MHPGDYRGHGDGTEGIDRHYRRLPTSLYSPDLNPIELALSKLKAMLRKAGARTVEDLWRVIAELLDEFPPNECQNYFRHAGYERH